MAKKPLPRYLVDAWVDGSPVIVRRVRGTRRREVVLTVPGHTADAHEFAGLVVALLNEADGLADHHPDTARLILAAEAPPRMIALSFPAATIAAILRAGGTRG